MARKSKSVKSRRPHYKPFDEWTDEERGVLMDDVVAGLKPIMPDECIYTVTIADKCGNMSVVGTVPPEDQILMFNTLVHRLRTKLAIESAEAESIEDAKKAAERLKELEREADEWERNNRSKP